MSQTLRDVLAGHVARQPEGTFLVAPETGRRLSYRELERQSHLLARWLRAAGLRRGDKVGLYLHNGYQTALLFLGAMVGGFVAAPLNLLSQRSQLAYVLEHCDCKVLFTAREYEKQLGEALAAVKRPIEAIVIDPDAPGLFLEERLPAGKIEPVAAEDPALLMYTSGTTGTPKGAQLSHRNLIAAARSVAAWHGLTPADRCLSSLPLYHINGQVIATVTPLVSGGSVIAPHRFSVSTWWEVAERCEATWINLVPTIVAYLLNGADPQRDYRFPRVRFGRSASAPLPPEQHRAFERTFGIPVIEAMGMTESASVVFANPQDPARRKYGTPGLPCGVEAKVVELQTGRTLPPNSPGEICLRGPNVMAAYYKSAEQTAKAFDREGWLLTGDLGYRDADGYYYFVARKKDIIRRRGENVSGAEIDRVVAAHPKVLEAAAIAVPGELGEDEILVVAVTRPGQTLAPDEIAAWCAEHLAPYKRPRFLAQVRSIPHTPTHRVAKFKLMQDPTLRERAVELRSGR